MSGGRRLRSIPLVLAALVAVSTPAPPAGAEAWFPTATGLTLWAWGSNATGQTGPSGGPRATTVGPRDITAVAASNASSMALTVDGTVLTWGNNWEGELGDGTTDAWRQVPQPVPGLPPIAAIDAGENHDVAVAADGRVFTWGFNYTGQLGTGAPFGAVVRTPTQVPGITTAVAAAAGAGHTLVLLEDGTVRAWGANNSGQLGNGSSGDNANTNTPGNALSNLDDVVHLAAGATHSLAVQGDGTVWAWGRGNEGELGTCCTSATTPQQVSGLADAVEVAAGRGHSLALTGDGTVYAFGSNTFGASGKTTYPTVSPPTAVPGVGDIVSISAGMFSSYALRDDGVVLAWGDNDRGELGDETTSGGWDVREAVLGNVVAVDGGGDHVLALTVGAGYWMTSQAGAVYAFGAAPHLGNAPTSNAVDLEATPSFLGYWIVDAAGHVFAFGDAPYLGGMSGMPAGESVTSLSRTATGRGYWLFSSKGRVFPFGDAVHLGDMRATALNGPVLDSVVTPSGRGYYLVASDGGVFAFGDAAFRGSMGGRPLNAPVQSLVPDADGVGYWLVASDGGVFAFEAEFRGSMGGKPLNRPMTGMVRFGNGYLMVAEDGGIFNFSDRPFLGSLGSNPPPSPIVTVAVAD